MSYEIHNLKFPNESENYRNARNELLKMEIELRSEIEKLAKAKQSLPLGGELKEDYLFEDSKTGKEIPLSELFPTGKDSLIIYSFMYGPDKEEPCPMCTSLIDGFDGNAPHVRDRAGFVVVAKSPPAKIQAFVDKRGWSQLQFLSSNKNSYNTDYHAENPEWGQMPALNVFRKKDGKIYHHYALESLYCKMDGQPRHADLLWPLWNLLDLTPEGRGTDWYPKIDY